MKSALSFVAALGAVLHGCGPWGCTPSFEPGIAIRLVDAKSGAEITTATVTISSGEYQEIVSSSNDSSIYLGALERPGVYSVTIEAPGYASRTINRVVVPERLDRCHVETQSLDLALDPL